MLRPRSEVRNLMSLSLHQVDKLPPSSIFLDHWLISWPHRGESVTLDRSEWAEGWMKETQSPQTDRLQPPTWNPVRIQTTCQLLLQLYGHFRLFTPRNDSVPVSVVGKQRTPGFLFVCSRPSFPSPAQCFDSLSLFFHPLLVLPPHLLHLFKNRNTQKCAFPIFVISLLVFLVRL